MRIQKDNKAVSPVIGIMLMLVVTVILAAAVSSSSSGLMKSTEKAPFAVFDVKVAKDVGSDMGVVSYFTIKQITGDSINTKDLKIVTQTPAGVIKEKLPSAVETYTYYNNSTGVPNNASIGNAPYLNNVAKGSWPDESAVHFGNFNLKPGVTMSSQQYAEQWGAGPYPYATWNASSKTYDLSTGNIGLMQDMFGGWDDVQKGDFVNVKLIHMPSNKVIFASDVEVI